MTRPSSTALAASQPPLTEALRKSVERATVPPPSTRADVSDALIAAVLSPAPPPRMPRLPMRARLTPHGLVIRGRIGPAFEMACTTGDEGDSPNGDAA